MYAAVAGGSRDFAAEVEAVVSRAGDAGAMTTEDLAQSRWLICGEKCICDRRALVRYVNNNVGATSSEFIRFGTSSMSLDR